MGVKATWGGPAVLARLGLECRLTGRPALRRGELGQVGNGAATAVYCKCRGNGSSTPTPFFPSRPASALPCHAQHQRHAAQNALHADCSRSSAHVPPFWATSRRRWHRPGVLRIRLLARLGGCSASSIDQQCLRCGCGTWLQRRQRARTAPVTCTYWRSHFGRWFGRDCALQRSPA